MRIRNIAIASTALMAVLLSFAVLALASTDFVAPPGRSSNPYSMIVGPDHNLWFAELDGEKIGRITTAGVITEFPIPGAQALIGIAAGSDGNIWFTDQLTGKVGHISTSGGGIKEFALPKGSSPQSMAAGPDGNLWFVVQEPTGLFKIGKITVSGTVTEYATNVNVGTFQAYPASGSFSVMTSCGGDLWFVNPQNLAIQEIGKITTGGTITFYPLQDIPFSVACGPDGNVWATEGSHVAKITLSGTETEYALTQGGSTGITSGPDGNIWFTEANNSVDVVTPAGVVTEYPTVYPTFWVLASLTSGPDGAVWFTGDLTSNIGRVTTSGQLTNTYALSTGSTTGFDALGPDGNIWFTELIPGLVGKVTPTGVVTTYQIPSPDARPESIAAGADGNLWFIETGYGRIAKTTTSGSITEYPLAGTYAEIGLALGADGNIWYPVPFSYQGPSIAQITPAGVITLFALPNSSAVPLFIAAGPDGNLWFTDIGTNQVGKIDTSGSNAVEYPVLTSNANLSVITAGPDGNLWFIENTAFGAVAKITTTGTVTEYPAEVQNFQDGIMAAPDGAIWFTQCYPNSVARITTAGVLSTVPLTTLNACGNALTVGSDGKIWVAEGVAGALGRLSAIGGTGKTVRPTHGTPFTGSVASFVDGTSTATKSNFTASISWGDSTKSAGTVTGATGGPFSVSGTHTYTNAGTYNLVITLTDSVDKSTYTASPGKAKVN